MLLRLGYLLEICRSKGSYTTSSSGNKATATYKPLSSCSRRLSCNPLQSSETLTLFSRAGRGTSRPQGSPKVTTEIFSDSKPTILIQKIDTNDRLVFTWNVTDSPKMPFRYSLSVTPARPERREKKASKAQETLQASHFFPSDSRKTFSEEGQNGSSRADRMGPPWATAFPS